MFIQLIKCFLLILPVMLCVGFMTLLERKILSLVGTRVGPNKVSFIGLLQPITDAGKLSNKQFNLLSNFSFSFYYISSFFTILFSLILWSCLCSEPSVFIIKLSLVVFMIVLGLNSFSVILAGWSSFSKFSLIGSIRTVAQLVSYEAALYFCFFFFLFIFFSFNLYDFSFYCIYFSFMIFPFVFYIWLPSMLADLNRTPYDFSEGESELVSGFNTEFGAASFVLLFLAEYSNIIFFCVISSYLFFWGWTYFFFFLFLFYIVWIRSVLPRYRFDKLMLLSWKFFIPFSSILFLFYIFN